MKNHGSASRHLNGVLKAILKGQDAGQYLVLDDKVLHIWKNIQISPLGAVTKKDCDPEEDIRLIHDRRGTSTNDMSKTELSPDIEYKHIAAIARRIIACRTAHKGVLVNIMKGDVKGAFRHLMVASEHVHWMAATIPELGVLVVDMSALFGWTSTPAFYGAFGGAITWLVSRECPASMDTCSYDQDHFFAYEWVNDHVLVEPDPDNGLRLANEALRLAMLAILGPASINEEKFSAWETKLQVLGLEFDTKACTISMPTEKIAKALGRVQALQYSRTQHGHNFSNYWAAYGMYARVSVPPSRPTSAFTLHAYGPTGMEKFCRRAGSQ
ncbi:hypothetical protein PR003_g8694 [Phytophthora rubi]|uniref:Reverse transcriptase domain-containing protein n=1 Tax=Phytophthora rubi TaxID=129364 RepID=A0A6A4FAI8_9STRA|nr:hypothetical protein PR002_g13757 [Phytophthora rubi]KAE9038621.1 hypothetical protein PR001_g7881 [Phytophthora rubi]KAE9343991.1 hypothetical protein PR003_g8694 [Phytophthora rubi]